LWKESTEEINGVTQPRGPWVGLVFGLGVRVWVTRDMNHTGTRALMPTTGRRSGDDQEKSGRSWKPNMVLWFYAAALTADTQVW